MSELKIDQEMIGKLAKALSFILKPNDPTVIAFMTAHATGSASDVKKARTLFLKLKPGDRQAALAMLGL